VVYPQDLVPKSYESIKLLTGQIINVPKAAPTFKPWLGSSFKNTYGGKQVIEWNDEAVFAELAILRILQSAGWEGVWIDTYSNKRRVAIDRIAELPFERNNLLQQIFQSADSRFGCFDIYCWRDTQTLFAEAKRFGRDKIRDSQRRWLAAALAHGLPVESFLIVEWTLLEL
jgi:hypothetical protein